jgi:uncharacterized repeat protein (TIGR03803 family)
MNSSWTNSRKQGGLNIFDAGARFGSTKVAGAILRGALILAAIVVLVLITAGPARGQTETVLYSFTGGSDGGGPLASLTSDSAGNLYGTTYGGGLWGYGTVFELSPNGSGGWNETVLYSFTGGADGGNPNDANVMFDSVGNLYGTAFNGGENGYGVVFELSPVGGGSWTETVLYSFCSQVGCVDGANPHNGLIMDSAGNLYGTLWDTLPFDELIVFELSPSPGGWTEQVIFSLKGDAALGGLMMDGAGNIYGASGLRIYKLIPNGQGGWSVNVLHLFTNSKKDGMEASPGAIVLGPGGNLYGTTAAGGGRGTGTVYMLGQATKGKHKGQWVFKILHSCNKKYGSLPYGGIVFDSNGDIFGTTLMGGAKGNGTVFSLEATGWLRWKFGPLLFSFDGTDGNAPYSTLIWGSGGNLYGTTAGGGAYGNGTVFEITP